AGAGGRLPRAPRARRRRTRAGPRRARPVRRRPHVAVGCELPALPGRRRPRGLRRPARRGRAGPGLLHEAAPRRVPAGHHRDGGRDRRLPRRPADRAGRLTPPRPGPPRPAPTGTVATRLGTVPPPRRRARMARHARVERDTKETKVLVEVDLDGTG